MKRRTITIDTDTQRFRVFKSDDGSLIHVYAHDIDETMTEIMGRAFYAIEGTEVAYYETGGWATLKAVAAEIGESA